MGEGRAGFHTRKRRVGAQIPEGMMKVTNGKDEGEGEKAIHLLKSERA